MDSHLCQSNLYSFLFSMDYTSYVEPAASFALANGLLHGETVTEKQYFTHMPFSLFPFPVN